MLEGKRDKLGIQIAIFLTVLIPVLCSTSLAAPEHAHWGLSSLGEAFFVDDGSFGFVAQSFVADATETVTKIKGEYTRSAAVEYDLKIEIRADSSGSPDMSSSGLLGTATVTNSEIWDWELNGWPTGESGTVQKTLSPSVNLTSGSTYWIVWRGTGAGSMPDFVDVVYHGNHESSGMGVSTSDNGETWTQITGGADFVYEFDGGSPGPGPDPGPNIGPVPPEGLVLIVGVGWVDLSWNASTEPDLADDGYRLYRREISTEEEGAGEHNKLLEFPVDYELVADGSGTWFHDATVQSGMIYGYVISVKDEDGNESGPSDEVNTAVPVYGPGAGTGGGGCFLSTAR